MLSLKNVKSPDSNFVNFPKVGAYGAKGSNYGSYFIDGTGEIVHAKEWRKKGSTVWHSMDEYFTIDSTLSPEDYRGTATIEVKFEVDTVTEHGGKDYQGMTYVVFQELYTEN